MDEREDNSKKRDTGRTKSLLSVTTLVFVGCLAAYNYTPPINKTFSPTYYYNGQYHQDASDPKTTYAIMQGIGISSSSTNGCTAETMVKYTNSYTFPGTSGGIWMTTEDPGTMSEDELRLEYAIDVDNPDHLYLWKDAEDKRIISPFQSFYFVNFNGKGSSNTAIKISASSSEEYVVSFYNVKNWFCHLNATTTAVTHTIDTRTTCSGEQIGGPYVLGMATENTYVVVEQNGSTENTVDPFDYFLRGMSD